MISPADMWNEICFLLSTNVRANCLEKDFEKEVVRALEVLGWRESRQEIQRQEAIPVGRKLTVRPDLVIRNGSNKQALIVVEVKAPTEDIARDNAVAQLKSYMRQLKADFGILVGSGLRIYYDEPMNTNDRLLLLEAISFTPDDSQGINFATNFCRTAFLEKNYEPYLADKIKDVKDEAEINKLMQLIMSDSTSEEIIAFLKDKFISFGGYIFDETMKRLSINITNKTHSDLNCDSNKELYQITTSRKPKIDSSIKDRRYGGLSCYGHRIDSMAGAIDTMLRDGVFLEDALKKLMEEHQRTRDKALNKFKGHVTYLKKRGIIISVDKQSKWYKADKEIL